MGITDVFSNRKAEERHQRIMATIAQLDDENIRIAQNDAVNKARHASARHWFDEYGKRAADGYDALLAALFDKDAEGALAAMCAAGPALPVIAAAPVYMADGAETIAFADMAEKILPDAPGVAYALRAAAEIKTPEGFFDHYAVADYYKEPQKIPVYTSRHASFMDRLSGYQEAEQRQWQRHYRDMLSKFQFTIAPRVLEQGVQQENEAFARLAKLQETLALRPAIASAFARQDMNAALRLADVMAEKKVMAEIDALSAGENNTPFSAQCFAVFGANAGASALYERLVLAGARPAPAAVINAALENHDSAVIAALQATIDTVSKDDFRAAIIHAENGSLAPLARAFNDAAVMPVLLQALGSPLERAAALYELSARTPDARIAQGLHAEAQKAAGGDTFLHTGNGLLIRRSAILCARRDNDNDLRVSTPWDSYTFKQDARAVLDVLAHDPRFIALTDNLYYARDALLSVQFSEDGKRLTVRHPRDSHDLKLDEESAAKIKAALTADARYIAVDRTFYNIDAMHHIRVNSTGAQYQISMKGHGREYTVRVLDVEAEKFLQELPQKKPDFIRVDSRNIVNAAHLSAVARQRSNMRFLINDTGFDREMSPEAQQNLLNNLVRHHGYVDLENGIALNAAKVGLARLEATTGKAGRLRLSLGGYSLAAQFDDLDAASVQLIKLRNACGMERFDNGLSAPYVRVSALGIMANTGEIKMSIHGREWAHNGGRSESSDTFARYNSRMNMVDCSDTLLVNAQGVDLIRYNNKELYVFGGGYRRSASMSEFKAETIIQSVIRRGNLAERADELKVKGAGAGYREKPSPK